MKHGSCFYLFRPAAKKKAAGNLFSDVSAESGDRIAFAFKISVFYGTAVISN